MTEYRLKKFTRPDINEFRLVNTASQPVGSEIKKKLFLVNKSQPHIKGWYDEYDVELIEPPKENPHLSEEYREQVMQELADLGQEMDLPDEPMSKKKNRNKPKKLKQPKPEVRQ